MPTTAEAWPSASQVQNCEQCTSVVWSTWCMVFVIATELKHPFLSEITSLTWRLLCSELVLTSHFKIITSIGTMSENIAWSSPFYHIHFDHQINKGKKNCLILFPKPKFCGLKSYFSHNICWSYSFPSPTLPKSSLLTTHPTSYFPLSLKTNKQIEPIRQKYQNKQTHTHNPWSV